MIGQVTPLVKAANRRTWWQTVLAHSLGACTSAAILGLVLGSLGQAAQLRSAPATVRLGALSMLILLCALHDGRVVRVFFPSLSRQTPKTLQCELGPIWAGFAWGIDLGQGWTTLIEFAGYYALVASALALANPLVGTVVLAAYGLGRASPLLPAGLLATRAGMVTVMSWYVWRKTWILCLNAGALGLLAGYFLGSAAVWVS